MNRSLLAALLLGAVTVTGFSPFDVFPLPLVSLALLFVLWRGAATPRYAALIGFVWGLGFFLVGVSWVYVSLHDIGGMALPLAAAATLLFCAYLALFPSLAGYAFARLRSASLLCNVLLLAGSWTLTEWLRGWLLTGFPWLSLGYSQVGVSPLAGYAPLFGGYGVGFVTALVAALLSSHWWRRDFLLALIALIGAGALLKSVPWTEATGEPVSVSLLQGNVPQSLKWDPQRLDLSLISYRHLVDEHPAQLIVLPETAIPLLFDQISPDYLRELAGEHELLLGAAIRSGRDSYANAAVAISDGAPYGFYAKSHLVPFGEYVPPGFGWFFDWVRIPMTDFSRAPAPQKPLTIGKLKVAPNICYEDLFGEEIISQLPEATVLINLSNTAWFGHSLAQPQHLQISRMRALETGRPMLRATNTGMTAAIAPDGIVYAVLPAFEQGALTVNVQGYRGTTPYVLIGNLGALLLAALAVLPAVVFRKRSAI